MLLYRKEEESKRRGRVCTLVAQSAVIYRPYSLQFHLMDLKETLCSTTTLVLQNQYSSIKEITFIPLTGFQKDANLFSRRVSGHAKWKGASKNEYSYSSSFHKKRGSGGKAILKMACKIKLPLASFKLCDSHLCKMLLEEFLGSHYHGIIPLDFTCSRHTGAYMHLYSQLHISNCKTIYSLQ